METMILILHVLVSTTVVGLILLQQKNNGTETNTSFGSGVSQTVFGSQGTGYFISRITTILATVFFLTSFMLAMIANNIEESIPTMGGNMPFSLKTTIEKGIEKDSPVIESITNENQALSLPQEEAK